MMTTAKNGTLLLVLNHSGTESWSVDSERLIKEKVINSFDEINEDKAKEVCLHNLTLGQPFSFSLVTIVRAGMEADEDGLQDKSHGVN